VRFYNRIVSIFRERTGASLLFVLGIMMFLMAIGVSTMTAASANASYVFRQRDYSRAQMLDKSVHESILHSLQFDAASQTSLSFQLADAVYKANDPASTTTYSASGLADINLRVNVGGIDIYNTANLVHVVGVTLSFSDETVNITPPLPAIYELDEEGIKVDPPILLFSREPKTATFSARMTVEVEINARGRTIISKAYYEYSGGKLTDDPTGIYGNIDSNATYTMVFIHPDGYGSWRMINHEIIGS